MEDPRPPDGYVARPVTLEDAPIIADLFNATTLAEAGVAWTTEEEVRSDLSTPGFSLDRDVALVVDDGGRAVAGLLLLADDPEQTDAFALGLVHPDAWGRGLGWHLLDLGEVRAARRLRTAPPGPRIVHVARFLQNEAAAQLFHDHGYHPVRTFWTMTRDLDGDLPAVPMPDGIELRPFEPDRDAVAVHEALREAFEDHWGHGTDPFEIWRHDRIDAEGSRFDPALWFVAIDGDEVAGVLVGVAGTGADPETGSVDELGVRRPWRGRGVGIALLSAAFRAFHDAGLPRATLVVDSENPTGATRLYERAGMRQQLAWDRWEKELGVEG